MTSLTFNALTRAGADHYLAIKKCLGDIFEVAEGYGGQSGAARRILLSLYAPNEYQMSGNDFATLDTPHVHNAICVLHEYSMCRIQIFSLIDDSEKRLTGLKQRLAANR